MVELPYGGENRLSPTMPLPASSEPPPPTAREMMQRRDEIFARRALMEKMARRDQLFSPGVEDVTRDAEAFGRRLEGESALSGRRLLALTDAAAGRARRAVAPKNVEMPPEYVTRPAVAPQGRYTPAMDMPLIRVQERQADFAEDPDYRLTPAEMDQYMEDSPEDQRRTLELYRGAQRNVADLERLRALLPGGGR